MKLGRLVSRGESLCISLVLQMGGAKRLTSTPKNCSPEAQFNIHGHYVDIILDVCIRSTKKSLETIA